MEKVTRLISYAKKCVLLPANARIPIRVLRPLKKWMNGPMIPDFSGWHFDEGMKYGDKNMWWRGGVIRKEPHNGIDYASYISINGNKKNITPGTRIANIYDGEIAAITEDVIRSTVFVKHRIFSNGLQFYTIFGHIKVSEGLKERGLIKARAVIGEVSEVPQGSAALPHLHLSMAWIPKNISRSLINWQSLDEHLFINPKY